MATAASGATRPPRLPAPESTSWPTDARCASDPQSWSAPAIDKWCRASRCSVQPAPKPVRRWLQSSPVLLGSSSRSCAEITSSRSIPRCARFQHRDQPAQCRPRDEKWQTALVNANVRDGTAIHLTPPEFGSNPPPPYDNFVGADPNPTPPRGSNLDADRGSVLRRLTQCRAGHGDLAAGSVTGSKRTSEQDQQKRQNP